MGAFSSPPKPKVPKVPRPPVVDETRIDEDAQRRLRERRGYAASLLTGEAGIPSPKLGAKSLLGG